MNQQMIGKNYLPLSLFLLRISVFVVMLMWTIDKFVNPDHAAAVYAHFYFIKGIGHQLMFVIGTAELLILVTFLAGALKFWSYGFVMLAHAVSTLSSFRQYLDPFADSHLLFFAAWPMLAACIALFLLRDRDTLFSIGR